MEHMAWLETGLRTRCPVTCVLSSFRPSPHGPLLGSLLTTSPAHPRFPHFPSCLSFITNIGVCACRLTEFFLDFILNYKLQEGLSGLFTTVTSMPSTFFFFFFWRMNFLELRCSVIAGTGVWHGKVIGTTKAMAKLPQKRASLFARPGEALHSCIRLCGEWEKAPVSLVRLSEE